MDRKRRTTKYPTPASSDSNQTPPVRSTDEPDMPNMTKKRNPSAHQPQGFRPEPAPKQHQSKRTSARRKALYILILAVLLCLFVYAAYQVIEYLFQTRLAIQEEQKIQTMIAQSETSAPTEELATPSPTPTEDLAQPTPTRELSSAYYTSTTPARPEVLIQFNSALAVNPDTVGQLEMGESINTYVVQRDNSYYLRRSFSGEYSFSGAIFLDVTCSIYPKSRNLILHGHNMHNGTAFGKLSRFDDIDYLNKYPHIQFSTLYETSLYIPFAVVYYSIDPDSEIYLDIYRINSLPDQEFVQYISKIQAMSEYHIPVYVSRTDKIITITTCATGDDDMRFAVFAVENKAL